MSMSEHSGVITLGIEMSNPSARGAGGAVSHSVALWDARGALLGSAPLPDSQRGSDAVMHAVSVLADSCGVRPGDVARVIVSIGPGGYTALRIATTSAKVLADTLGAELVGVPAARVASVAIGAGDLPALIVLATKKGKGHVSVLAGDGSIESLGVVGPGALGGCGARSLHADQHLPDAFRAFADSAGIAVCPIELDARALLLASAGIGPMDPLRLAPLYAREPDAVTQWRARGSG